MRGAKDFRRVLSEGRRHRRGGIAVVLSPGKAGPPRLGLVVSKRSGNAVVRNRIKRRLRHAVRGRQLEPGTDYVIIADSRVAEATFPTIVEWLDVVLEESE